jgi:choline-glycine betaine transporter
VNSTLNSAASNQLSFPFDCRSAGVAVGLFVYGVSEPLYHNGSHWFAAAGYHSQDELDMYAINLTITNWAIAGWAPYLVVSICMGLAGHRFKLPFTFRSCLYPILGEYTWGWIGDIVDGFTIVVTGTFCMRRRSALVQDATVISLTILLA